MRFYRVILDGADPLRQPRGLTMKSELMTQIVEFDKKEALEIFSDGFQHFLDRTGLKVKDIASAFDLTKAAVSSWKNGVSFPDYPKIFKLLEMGMTLDEMFGVEIAKTERINRLIVETEEMKKILSLWRKSSFSETSVEIEKEIANLNNKINAILVRIPECKSS